MQVITLSNDLNQTFTTTLDTDFYQIAIYAVGGTMACDITRNSLPVVTGKRITNGQFLIPYFAYFNGFGNFMLVTQNSELPDNTQFGITQTFFYFDPSEMAEVVAGTI